jgi:hypothetical protein
MVLSRNQAESYVCRLYDPIEFEAERAGHFRASIEASTFEWVQGFPATPPPLISFQSIHFRLARPAVVETRLKYCGMYNDPFDEYIRVCAPAFNM